MAEDGTDAPGRAQMRKAVLAATIGCGLEFYDFVTFAFFAIQIGQTFFPSDDPYTSLMGALATFGAGFVGRPVGAYVLGGLADRIGRRAVMLLSMALMGGAVTIMALTPGYAAIGAIAPVIVVLCRVTQGFALGGEVGAAMVYMVEASQPARRGMAGSWQAISQYAGASAGSLIGLALSTMLDDTQLAAYGWRIALLIGALVIPFALIIRRTLPDTLESAKAEHVSATPGGPSLRQIAILGAMMIGSGTIANYIFNYMVTYGKTQLHLSTAHSMAGELANNLAAAGTVFVGGLLCDRFGRRPLLIVPQILFCLIILPSFLWLTSSPNVGTFVLMNMALATVCYMKNPAMYVSIAESVAPEKRSRVFALVYALPVTVLGGTTQIFVTWLLKETGSPLSIAWYLTGVALVGLLAMVLLPESSPLHRKRKVPASAA